MLSLKSLFSWNTKPTVCSRSCVFISQMSTPPMLILPASTSQKRPSKLTRVVLPPPEGPTSAVSECSGMLSVMPFTAVRLWACRLVLSAVPVAVVQSFSAASDAAASPSLLFCAAAVFVVFAASGTVFAEAAAGSVLYENITSLNAISYFSGSMDVSGSLVSGVCKISSIRLSASFER